MTEVLNVETGELTEPIADEMTPDAELPSDDDTTTEPDAPDESERQYEPAPPPQPTGPSEAEMERGFKAVERAATAYAKKVGESFPDGALNLSTCPMCAGFIPAFVDVDQAGRLPEQVKTPVLAYLGLAREQDYEPDPQTAECDVCKGLGEVATGSRVELNRKRTCAHCNGYGYYPPPAGGATVAQASGIAHAPAGESSAPLEAPDVDATNEPRILPDGRPNPNYGKWPQYKIEVAPWGVTAGLTVQDVAA